MGFGCELGTPDAGVIDGTEPLGMTAKNGAPGGSFCVGSSGGRKEGETRHSGLSAAFCGVSGGCCGHHFANVGNMVGVVGLLAVGWEALTG
ncbi:MAG: hypothetical protein ACI358_09065 [Candidatus Limimorpha sp.]